MVSTTNHLLFLALFTFLISASQIQNEDLASQVDENLLSSEMNKNNNK